MSEALRYAHLGIQLAASMALSLGAGVLLDRWLDTSPWFTLAGATFGILALFGQLYRLTYELNQKKRHPRE